MNKIIQRMKKMSGYHDSVDYMFNDADEFQEEYKGEVYTLEEVKIKAQEMANKMNEQVSIVRLDKGGYACFPDYDIMMYNDVQFIQDIKPKRTKKASEYIPDIYPTLQEAETMCKKLAKQDKLDYFVADMGSQGFGIFPELAYSANKHLKMVSIVHPSGNITKNFKL